jgi:xylulokinase
VTEKNPLLVGVDIGTSGCKTVIMDQRGKVLEKAFHDYPLYVEKHGWSEQQPEDWWSAVVWTLKKVVAADSSYPSRIVAIGLTGQMHGIVPMDADGHVIRKSILWNDQRTQPQCDYIHEKVGGVQKMLKITNNPMLPGYTGGKILWIREHEPENYERLHKFLNPKDYIRFMMTGDYATEVSDASGVGLFDVKNRCWSEYLFDLLDIPREIAPKVYESTDITGYLSKTVAEQTGLPEGIPVVGGGGDAVIQTLGTGVINNRDLMTTIGTAGIISTALEEFTQNPDGRLQIFCNVIPDSWHIMGVILSGGSSLKWFRDRLCKSEQAVAEELGIDEYEILSDIAERSKPGSGGLIFLPYLGGERCPYPDPNLKAGFIGLSYNTEKGDMVRSVMEGVVFSLYDAHAIFKEMGMSFRRISTSGGGAQSRFWKQVHADIFQKQVITVNGSREGAAYGAAMVAAVGAGVWETFEEGVDLMKIETSVDPNTELKEGYETLYNVYHGLHDALKPSFDILADF